MMHLHVTHTTICRHLCDVLAKHGASRMQGHANQLWNGVQLYIQRLECKLN
ncbi:hypothetical protein ABEO76_21950 [Bacillus anthracis]|uniref:hypothetical protein n=1 Tax=Bacillus anthracis TaxID=1392 RepID=UPI003D25DB50